ncbi:MAG: hypothetical protein GY863_05280 [bacterium]|nr:hypothetical protein [bacterium]
MGWERENLIYIRMRGESEKSIGILKTELAKIPGVNKVSAGYCLPYAHYSSTTGIKWPDKNPEEKISLRYNFVDPEYMDILNLEMVEGKSFSKELMDESSSYVINETLARIIGIEPIIGTEIEFWGNPGRIIGVVKDFHTRSLRTEITPIIMMIRNYDEMNYTLIKLNPENTSSIMENISETWKSVLPEYPIEYGFIEDDLYNMYNDEGAMGIMMKGITIFTLLITCLGLMALVAFMTEKRKKEIGVRKVLGSSIPAIIKLISREFSALLTVTNVLACLAAYFLMKAFLGTYAYRTEIVWNEFILSCLLISAVAMLTISYQTFKAARANPVDTLRND